MEFRLIRITEDLFPEIYPVMEESFPGDERRAYEDQLALLRDPDYVMLGLKEEDRFAGFIAGWDFGDFVYGEHLAVTAARRNGGLGDRMVKAFLERFGKPFFIEVEPPETELTRRRIGFYERNGFVLNDYDYVQPSLGEGKDPVPLRIMTWPRGMDREELAGMERRIRQKLFKENQ